MAASGHPNRSIRRGDKLIRLSARGSLFGDYVDVEVRGIREQQSFFHQTPPDRTAGQNVVRRVLGDFELAEWRVIKQMFDCYRQPLMPIQNLFNCR
jgi:hypothetical protein